MGAARQKPYGGGPMTFLNHYHGRRVLVTGHTGFKGSWLALWLHSLGAKVTGWSIDVPTDPSLFELASVADYCTHIFGDINDADATTRLVADGDFDMVFHLAAQPLVRLSYARPLETIQTNILGTANVLEAVRQAGLPCTVVAITSDKCYANDGAIWGFRECDPMGGSDPYSMSKGAAELLIASWRDSYFRHPDSVIKLASARAGNVIGGGDWAVDRIITDCIEALMGSQPVEVRNPRATRPWQHVLEPLSGYLWLGAVMATDWNAKRYDGGWNFGPPREGVKPVHDLVERLIAHWGEGSWNYDDQPDAPKEATTLSLNCDKSAQFLDWRPVWDFDRTIAETARWYRRFFDRGAADMGLFTKQQIDSYSADAEAMGLAWAEHATASSAAGET